MIHRVLALLRSYVRKPIRSIQATPRDPVVGKDQYRPEHLAALAAAQQDFRERTHLEIVSRVGDSRRH